jgi:hypothetical protein
MKVGFGGTSACGGAGGRRRAGVMSNAVGPQVGGQTKLQIGCVGKMIAANQGEATFDQNHIPV